MVDELWCAGASVAEYESTVFGAGWDSDGGYACVGAADDEVSLGYSLYWDACGADAGAASGCSGGE